MCKKYPYSELLWSVFSRIPTEHGEIRSISLYSVPIRENADQNNSEYEHFLRSAISRKNPWNLSQQEQITTYPKTKKQQKKKITDAFDDKYIEYEYEGGRELSIEQYLEKMGPYLGNMVNNFRTIGKWNIQMTTKVKFMSLKEGSESQLMHSKSDNNEIMIGDDTNYWGTF